MGGRSEMVNIFFCDGGGRGGEVKKYSLCAIYPGMNGHPNAHERKNLLAIYCVSLNRVHINIVEPFEVKS